MSELRRDIVSGDWVLLAPGRAARPKFLDEKKKPRKPSPKRTCPFEDLEKSGNWPPVMGYPNEKNWKIVIIPNKYPAISGGDVCSVEFKEGIYSARTAVGDHSLIITREHDKHFVDLAKSELVELFSLWQEFQITMAQDECAEYVSSFYNWGPSAGASIWHPHYQVVTLPIIPAHVVHSLRNEKEYFKKNDTCARCNVVAFERKKKTRVVAENEHAIAIVPYASKKPFEVSVLPKKHAPSFRDASPAVIKDIAVLLQTILLRMKKSLNDPDLNFFIHDAPTDGKDYGYHHWHIEVIPKISIDAGFELSTGIEINIVDPDNGAAILRGKKI
jgi:UDPglucose--hexose-1-phosphate uridylyltransferase